MEPLCSISVWASSLSAHSRAACGRALWGLWARGCPLFSGGPQGAPKPLLTHGRRTLCLQTGLGDQLAGALFPQGPQCSGSWVTGLRPGWEERGCLSVRQQGGIARGEKEDEVDVSCVHLSTDWRSISEDSAGERAPCAKWQVFSSISVRWSRGWLSLMFLHVGGQFSYHCFLRRLSFPLCLFLVWFSWTDHVHVGSFLESMCLCSWQFLTVVVTTGPWCSLKSERKMPPAVFFFLRVFLVV